MATFTATPDFGATCKITPSVRQTKFGDGYEQRVSMGINTQPRTWSLNFTNRSQAEADYITNFLAARAGVESFTWTDPDGVSGKYKCATWQRTNVSYRVYNITCDFVQVFEP